MCALGLGLGQLQLLLQALELGLVGLGERARAGYRRARSVGHGLIAQSPQSGTEEHKMQHVAGVGTRRDHLTASSGLGCVQLLARQA